VEEEVGLKTDVEGCSLLCVKVPDVDDGMVVDEAGASYCALAAIEGPEQGRVSNFETFGWGIAVQGLDMTG
jgi:hypothetical protein